MAALLDIRHLRRHALPDFVAGDLDHEIDRRERGPGRDRRPHLVANWHAGADGRPVCVWFVSTVPCDRLDLEDMPDSRKGFGAIG
jgi:hypothetical protein